MPGVVTIEGQPASEAVRASLVGERVLLLFSGGKDSIAAWLALEDSGVDFVPAYLYYVPGLRFVEVGLNTLEERLGRQIRRYPHPALFRWLNSFTFQAPERLATIEAAAFPSFSYEDVCRMVKHDVGLPDDAWVADGVRAADSIVRRTSFSTHGVMKRRNHKVSVVWDWRKSHVMERIAAAGVELPVDYQWFGRSFDGIDYRFLEPLSRFAPDDYQRVLDWFPLAELELMRHGL